MRARPSPGARHHPPVARRPRRRPRPAGVLGLRRGGRGGPPAVLGLPRASCAFCAATRCRALRAAGPMRAALSVAGLGAWPRRGRRSPSRARRARSSHALKFRGALAVADTMAAQVVAGAPPGLLAAPAALVPVPTHPLRRRVRGFDHAECLAAAIAARTGLPVVALPGTRGRADPPGRGRRGRRAGRRDASTSACAAIHRPAPCWSTMCTRRAPRSTRAVRRCDERGPTPCVRSPTHGR